MNDMSDVEPWSFVAGDGTSIDVTGEHLDHAQRLINEGACQVSRKHRMVARLPPGKTGVQALIEAERATDYPHPDLDRWARGLGDRGAGDQYMRCYADTEGNVVTLDIPTFAAFRKLGGNTYR